MCVFGVSERRGHQEENGQQAKMTKNRSSMMRNKVFRFSELELEIKKKKSVRAVFKKDINRSQKTMVKR